jgi:hypothetical protein
MASGIINLTSSASDFYGRIVWTSTFVADKIQPKSTFTFEYQIRRSGTSGNVAAWNVKTNLKLVEGASLVGSALDKTTGNISIAGGADWKTIHTSSHTVLNHKTSGRAIISVTCNITGSPNGVTFNTTNTSVEFDRYIKWATLTSAPSFTDEENPRITYSNPSGTSVTSLQACIANSTGGLQYVKYRDINKQNTAYTFSLSDAERKVLRAAASESNTLDVRFYIKTVIDGETYTSSLPKVMTIVNANPVIAYSITDVNTTTSALTGNSSTLVKYYSNAKATMTVTPQKEAALNEDLYIIRNGNNTAYATSTTFNAVENNTFTFSAEDSRGNYTLKTATPTMVNYVKLTCNMDDNLPNAAGAMTVTCHGNYFNGFFGAVSNSLTVQYRYKLSTASAFGSWTNMTATTQSGHQYTATASLSGLDYTKAYVFQCRAVDKLATVTSAESTVRSIPQFHWGADDFVFEVPVTFNAGATGISGGGGTSSGTIEGDCNITGDLRLKGSGNYGNTLYFGDGSYCYIKEATDDTLTLNASDMLMYADSLNLNVDELYFKNKSIAYGTWTPTLTSTGAVSSYTVQQGWYQKLGSVVTIGWQIKAIINSGYNASTITISGVPFTPTYDASGGGICSGAYVSAGLNFECWVVNTSKNITARVQSCNNTSAANLTTSASGLCYRSGGGEMTLGGTITFMTDNN